MTKLKGLMKTNLCQILLKRTSINSNIGHSYGTTEKVVASKFSGMQNHTHLN